jgi:hypothetical protein
MRSKKMILSKRTTTLLRITTFFMIPLLLSTACGAQPTPTSSEIDLEPFIAMAQAADCANLRNRLFVIDDAMVLWDRAGQCADNSYDQMLFATKIDELLCEHYDSLSGRVFQCYREGYEEMFTSIVNNLDDSNLGLGPDHEVEEIMIPSS